MATSSALNLAAKTLARLLPDRPARARLFPHKQEVGEAWAEEGDRAVRHGGR